MTLKRKIVYIVFTLMAFVSLSSCRDDSSITEQAIEVKDGNGLLTFSIGIPAAEKLGKSSKAGNTDPGSAGERQINTFRIVFYLGDIVYKRIDLDVVFDGSIISGAAVENSGTTITPVNDIYTFQLKPIELKRDNYSVVALANPPQAVKNLTEVGQTLSGLMSTPYISNTLTADMTLSSGFYMANVSGAVAVSSDQFKPTEQDAKNATDKPSLALERAVAKVTFDVNLTGQVIIARNDTTFTLTPSTSMWTVDVTNKEMYWLRHMTYMKGGMDTKAPNNNMEQQSDYLTSSSRRLQLYAKDPNFTGIYSLPQTTLNGKFNYTDLINSATWYTPGTSTPVYIPENTMDFDEDFKLNVSTQIVIRIPFTSTPSSTATVLYYRVPIRHFMDNVIQDIGGLANNSGPGGDEEVAGGGGYVGSAVRYWGAYGVVRNNLYQLQLNSIKHVGELIPKNPPDTIQNVY